jgi:hypothetical protein
MAAMATATLQNFMMSLMMTTLVMTWKCECLQRGYAISMLGFYAFDYLSKDAKKAG